MADDAMGTCPLGGRWYTCTSQVPTFFGCCTSNPCNNIGCLKDDLRAAGMGSGGSGNLVNSGSYGRNASCEVGLWWTCSNQDPTFQGCCESDPCDGSGCPHDHLHPAAFKSSTFASVSTPQIISTIASMPSLAFTLTSTHIFTTPRLVSTTTAPITRMPSANPSSYMSMSHPPSNYTTSLNHTSFSNRTTPRPGNIYFETISLKNTSAEHRGTPLITSIISTSTLTAVKVSTYTVPTATPTPTLSANFASASLHTSTSSNGKSIALGVTGGIAALILVFAILAWWLRRRRNNPNIRVEKPSQPFTNFTNYTSRDESSPRNTGLRNGIQTHEYGHDSYGSDERGSLGFAMLMEQVKSDSHSGTNTQWSHSQSLTATSPSRSEPYYNDTRDSNLLYPHNHRGILHSTYGSNQYGRDVIRESMQRTDSMNGYATRLEDDSGTRYREREQYRPSYQTMSDDGDEHLHRGTREGWI